MSNQLAEQFEQEGFAMREAFVSPAWCERLKERIRERVANFEPGAARSVFSTDAQTRTTDAYFLESGDDVRFFFEAEALAADGSLKVPKEQAINKIGHALHRHDEVFRDFGDAHELEVLAQMLGASAPLALQSMAILKPPGIGGEVGWHQDATFLYTEPMSVVGLWIALADARRDNGCLWAIPGGHHGPLRERFIRGESGHTHFEQLDATPFATDRAVPLEVPAGTLIALHGRLPHRSDANRSSTWRHAYSVHVIDRNCAYPTSNWLRTPLITDRAHGTAARRHS